MKKTLTLLLPILLVGFSPAGFLPSQEPMVFMGFQLGMSRDAVQEVYDGFVQNQVATHISLEAENYRDLITLDNAFGSMGNKVELAYDESYVVTDITFQYKTVDILFEAAAEEAEAFVVRLCEEYGFPDMEMDDQGFVTLWTVILKEDGFKVSVDSMKNLRVQKLKT